VILPADFYQVDTPELAQKLLGKLLVHGQTSGIIVETEAYLGTRDPASHAYRGPGKRNAVMFGHPGHAYIYFTYGMHYCFNVVGGPEEVGEAVLIRALEPVDGIEVMQQRRKTDVLKLLCSGPAKLVQALGIAKEHNGTSLVDGPIQIHEPSGSHHPSTGSGNKLEIVTAPRIGISQAVNLPLRFYIKGSPFVSRI
jgi:DNA-3-methyladenine glycosylase